MSKTPESIDEKLAEWLLEQHVFFVATAPLSVDQHLNCSPKGGDSFRVIGPNSVAYLDYTGSGAETVAHIRENGRIILMFCAFRAAPNIVRLYGTGEVIAPGHPEFEALVGLFPENPATRSVIRVSVTRISSTCGFAVPLMDFVADREVLTKWAISKGPEALAEYRREKNAVSIDGLPAFGE